MKVLHLTDDMSLMGGVQRYLSMLEMILPANGVECVVWAPDPGPLGGVASRWYGRHFRERVRELIATEDPDLVHVHNLWMRLSPLPLRSAVEARVPVVMTVHDYTWVCPRKWMITGDDRPCETGFSRSCAISDCRGSHEGRRWLAYNALRWLKIGWHRRMLVRLVDRFVSPSRHLGRWMERSLGLQGVTHIPNFAEPPLVGPAGPVERHSTLLFAGRLGREKGVDVLLRAMPKVLFHHPEARLVVAGDGPERPALERLASELGLGREVSFEGALGPDVLGLRYAEAGLVVLPTLWMENCPVSVLEAFAHGRAVVATRIGGVPELVEDGTTGALFDRGDTSDLAERLSGLLADPQRIVEMGSNALAAWAESYTPERHAVRLRRFYDTAVQGSV